MRRALWAVLAAAVMAMAGFATSGASTGPFEDSTPTMFRYSPDVSPELRCAPLMLCEIILIKGESVTNIDFGDQADWSEKTEVINDTSHLFLKSQVPCDETRLLPGADYCAKTNIIVTTSANRIYNVVLLGSPAGGFNAIGFYDKTPESTRPSAKAANRENPSIPIWRQNGHFGPIQTPSPSPTPEETPTPPPVGSVEDLIENQRFPLIADPDHLDYDYKITGNADFRPLKVYNDGVHTFIELPARLPEFPALVAVDVRSGQDILINYHTAASKFFWVDSVPKRLALILGSGRNQLRVTIEHEK